MTKMFDKVSDSFLDAIKSVLEAKKTNKHGHDEVGKEDEDIDNDGDEDSSDKYLHNRRKAIGKAMMKKEEAQLDEISADMKGRYKKAAQRSLDSAQDFKSELDHEGEPKGSRVRKDVNRIIKNRKMGMKRANEEAQIDELSKNKLLDYMDKASDARGHRNLSTKKVDNRYAGVKKASDKLAKEEVEQIDELSKKTMATYAIKAKDQMGRDEYRAGVKMGERGGRGQDAMEKAYNKRADKRHKGLNMALNKLAKEEAELTSEEIAMIEAKMAGVAPGSMDCDKHMCATKVFHKEWNEGTPIKTMHAEPDADGLIEWYDVMFDHGIERVMTEDMEILQAESHMHSKKKMKEEVEEIDELSKATMGSYVNKAAERIGTKGISAGLRIAADEKSSGNFKDMGKRQKGIATAVSKLTKEEAEELDEARGRPKKMGAKDFTVHPVTKEKLMHNNPEHMKKIERLQKHGVLEKPKREADQHIMNQLSKAKTSMRGGETIHFTHGESKHVSGTHAAKLLSKYAGMKPSEKEDFQKKIGHSHEQLMKHV